VRLPPRLGALIALSCLPVAGSCVQTRSADVGRPVVQGELGARLDEFLERATARGFSGVVLVRRDGRVVLHKGYGWADREKRIPNTTKTIFEIGSLTKTFTAAAIVKLNEQGRLRTADSISRWFPNVPTDKAGITVPHQWSSARNQ
jgi:CubicO group peptidase (beta-lactamase class C family)